MNHFHCQLVNPKCFWNGAGIIDTLPTFIPLSDIIFHMFEISFEITFANR